MKGSSLIEICLSLCLVSLLTAALLQYYFVCQRQYFQAEKQFTENIELLLTTELMRDSIRRAGFTPCLNLSQIITWDNRNFSPLTALRLENNQILRVGRMNENFTTVLSHNEKKLWLENTALRKTPIIIADCYHAEVHEVSFQKKTSNGLEITLKNPLRFHYDNPIYIGEWLEEKYSIANDKKGAPALYYETSHKERLTTRVNALILNKTGHLIRVTLKQVNGKAIDLEVRLRSL